MDAAGARALQERILRSMDADRSWTIKIETEQQARELEEALASPLFLNRRINLNVGETISGRVTVS